MLFPLVIVQILTAAVPQQHYSETAPVLGMGVAKEALSRHCDCIAAALRTVLRSAKLVWVRTAVSIVCGIRWQITTALRYCGGQQRRSNVVIRLMTTLSCYNRADIIYHSVNLSIYKVTKFSFQATCYQFHLKLVLTVAKRLSQFPRQFIFPTALKDEATARVLFRKSIILNNKHTALR